MSLTDAASEAFDAFFSGSHDRCGQLLAQLAKNKGASDAKVQQNAQLNDYHKSGCVDPQAFLNNLTQVYERVLERDKKENGRRKKEKEEEEEEESYRDGDDHSILRYNQALLCVQLKHYSQASAILEELFADIEPMDDFLAIKTCFLLLELSLLQ